MATKQAGRELPAFLIGHVPPPTATAASIYSTMLFPQEGQELDRFACAQSICLDWRARYVAGDIEEDLPVSRKELFSVLDFLRHYSVEELISLRNEGIHAGYVLRFVHLLDRDSKLVASVKKAVALIAKLEPVGERTLQNRWSRFKDVSHLWAAYNEYSAVLQKVGSDWQMVAWLSFMKNPLPVLAIAEHYRNWAIRHVPRGGATGHTLETHSTWRVSDRIGPLPDFNFLNPELLYTGLTPEARELLERYRRK